MNTVLRQDCGLASNAPRDPNASRAPVGAARDIAGDTWGGGTGWLAVALNLLRS